MANHSSSKEYLAWIYRAWRYRLKLEKAEIRYLLRSLSAGEAAVSIGAHKGAYTYWMVRSVGPSGAVFAFEPQAQLAERLRTLVSSRGLRNVKVETLGVSSKVGTLTLTLPRSDGSPSASFERRTTLAEDAMKVPVEVTTLDYYFLEQAGAENIPISLIKCDVEGHELEVFRGGRRLLQEQGPDLLFECERRHRNSPVEEVFDFLLALDYKGWYFTRHGREPIGSFDVGVNQADPRARHYINSFLFTRRNRKPK